MDISAPSLTANPGHGIQKSIPLSTSFEPSSSPFHSGRMIIHTVNRDEP
jgi:hypothetical protein